MRVMAHGCGFIVEPAVVSNSRENHAWVRIACQTRRYSPLSKMYERDGPTLFISLVARNAIAAQTMCEGRKGDVIVFSGTLKWGNIKEGVMGNYIDAEICAIQRRVVELTKNRKSASNVINEGELPPLPDMGPFENELPGDSDNGAGEKKK